METTQPIETTNGLFEIQAEAKDTPIIERHFCGHTKRDMAIKALPIPRKPLWLNGVIKLIRLYQHRFAHKLGNRCVFDPSCSHYAEMAFRKNGFWKGGKQTIQRLLRCKPGHGGIDEPT